MNRQTWPTWCSENARKSACASKTCNVPNDVALGTCTTFHGATSIPSSVALIVHLPGFPCDAFCSKQSGAPSPRRLSYSHNLPARPGCHATVFGGKLTINVLLVFQLPSASCPLSNAISRSPAGILELRRASLSTLVL